MMTSCDDRLCDVMTSCGRLAAGGGGGGGGGGIQNRKQEPHTKMWGTTFVLLSMALNFQVIPGVVSLHWKMKLVLSVSPGVSQQVDVYEQSPEPGDSIHYRASLWNISKFSDEK